jgi:putative DNA primase/helicase
MPSIPDIAPDIIPEALRQWVVDGARSICVPASGIAAGIMVVLSSLLGRGVRILPEPGNEWCVTPNLWGAIVAPPGMLKSAVISYISAPLEPLIREANVRNRYLVAQAKSRRSVVEAAIKAEHRKKSGADVQTLTELNEELDEIRPGLRRYVIQDCTPEKLGELQMDNPRGLLQLRDELTGWLCSLSKTGREQERVYYLEGWDGDKSSTVDRIVRGSLYIESNCLSLFGAIQPSRLAPLIEGVISGISDDGLLQRLQCLVYVDSLPPWTSTPPPPSSAARARVEALVAAIDGLSSYANPRTMVFSPRAQALWEGWRGELESRIRNPVTPARLVAHVSKYRSMVPSLAAIAHMTHSVDAIASGATASAECRTICDACLSQAISWAEYLELHASHLYQISTPGMDSVHALARAIRLGTVSSGMSLRDIHRRHWARLDTPELVAQASATLEGIGWLRVQSLSQGGRPSQIVEISPLI